VVAFAVALHVQGEGLDGVIWEISLESEDGYKEAVPALINAYEAKTGRHLIPGQRGKVGIKVDTRGGRGLSTPLGLLRAVIEAFEARGFERQAILIVGYSVYGLREAGILPPLSKSNFDFEGCPIHALDSELYYNNEWFYDSPLPPDRSQQLQFSGDRLGESDPLPGGEKERRSFLPMPLLFDVDFWVNLAVCADDDALGVDGVLANATLWNVSNSQRFLKNEATASVAVAEIAAIPELNESMRLHFVSLNRYQYIGGPRFNSLYTHSEPLLWMSPDPVAMDRLLFERINILRRINAFPEIESVPRQLPFAASLGLGAFEKSRIQVLEVEALNRHSQRHRYFKTDIQKHQ